MKGYFLWSAQDSLEWIWGAATDLEIVDVDLDTGWTPKVSAEWFGETEEQNAVA